MPSFEAEGTIIKIFPVRVVSERFQVREFILSVEEGNYSQELQMQCTQDNCDLLDTFKEGEKVKVSSWIRGRKWQRSSQDEPKWFNSLVVRTIELADTTTQNIDQSSPFQDDVPPPTFNDSLDNDDLPF